MVCLSLLAGFFSFPINTFSFRELKILKLSKESKKLQWSKLTQTALLFDGFTFFPVRSDKPICFPDL